MASADMEGPEPSIESSDVVTKYQEAGRIATLTLNKVVAAAVEGAAVLDLCKLGDESITKEATSVFTKKVEGQSIPRGIAFPTCISINNVVCHFSPLSSEAPVVLKKDDVVKIDLGAQIDGYPSFAAKTIVVGATKDNVVTGRKADAILAAYNAFEAAIRLIKPGNTNTQVTAAIQEIAENFKCKPIENMLSYQVTRFRIDGDKSIITNPPDNTKNTHSECKFEANEVYAVDVLVSTGDGKTKESEFRSTVFKRTNYQYSLKLKTSRTFFAEITNKFTTFPFSLRATEDETKSRMGVLECVSHHLLEPYSVIVEKDGEFVAQFKTLILVTANNTSRTSDVGFDADLFKSEHKVANPELAALIATPLSKKKTKKAAKENADAAAAATAAQ